MQGRRIPDGEWWNHAVHPAPWQPGDYGMQGAHLACLLPDGTGPCMLPSQDTEADVRWDVTREDDGTITVSPSIWHDAPNGWHGFLERGVWRSV
jgi:hypothetical protein